MGQDLETELVSVPLHLLFDWIEVSEHECWLFIFRRRMSIPGDNDAALLAIDGGSDGTGPRERASAKIVNERGICRRLCGHDSVTCIVNYIRVCLFLERLCTSLSVWWCWHRTCGWFHRSAVVMVMVAVMVTVVIMPMATSC